MSQGRSIKCAVDVETIFKNADRKQKLKKLLEKGLAIGNNIESADQLDSLEEINKIIRSCDDINNSMVIKDVVNNTTEICLDAHILRMNHSLLGKVMNHCNVEFSEHEFSNAILSIVQTSGEGFKWEAFEEIACRVARTARFSSSMLGAFDLEPDPDLSQAKKVRSQRAKKNLTEEMRPENVHILDKQDKGVQKVNLIFRQLTKFFTENNYKPVPLFKFIIDPTDFMITVDNLLHLSFLAKDNNIIFLKGEDGYPAVRPATKQERERKTYIGHDSVNLNMAFVQDMMEFYDIEEPMIKLNRSELDQTQR